MLLPTSFASSSKGTTSMLKKFYWKSSSILSVLVLVISSLSFAIFTNTAANAQVRGLSIDFAAAEPSSYDHLVGGGQWQTGNVNQHIARSLAGDAFRCGDVVSYLSKYTLDNSTSIRDLEPLTVTSDFSFSLDTTGQSGAILGDVLGVSIDATDPAQVGDKNSVAILESEAATGPAFTQGSELLVTVRVSDLERNETVIMRMDVKIICDPRLQPTGDLQAKFKDARLTFKNGSTPVIPADPLNQGVKTVPLKKLNLLAIPQLSIQKTVTTGSASCPGVESLIVMQNDSVKYCYAVLNTDNGSGNPPAPIYNLSVISDDGGIYAGFDVPLTSGLSDQDGDGQVDDLAAGAIAYAEVVKSFNPSIETTILNTASVFGYDSIINPVRLDASDTASLTVQVPALVPAISINKLTNGGDSVTVLIGEQVIWSYQLINTGNSPLSNIAVTDNQGVVVTCPQTTLAPGQSITCDGAGVAQLGAYSNIGTVTATYLTTTVTDSDASSYFGAAPSMTIDKRTNGSDNPRIAVGDTVTWTYLVTNTGNIAIDSLVVIDDQGVAVSCPTSTLAVGEATTCTGTGTAVAGPYENKGTARANFQGTVVSAEDDSQYFGVLAAMTLDKTTNGSDSSTIITLTPIQWQYLVQNTGNVSLSNIAVVDDQGVTVTCPQSTLAAGDSMTCTGSGAAAEGWYYNVGTVTGNNGSFTATASDASSYFGAKPLLTLKKFTNGGESPDIPVGDPVTWTYLVTNTGNVTVSEIAVVDDQGVVVTCPKTVLAVAEAMTCSGTGSAVAGWYRNLGTVTGTFQQTNVQAQDSSTYFGSNPSLSLNKETNGSDAPTIPVGSPVTWTYQVTNTGNVPLSSLLVTDDQGVSVSCPETMLAVTETIQCSATGTAVAGPYSNIGTATASYLGRSVSDTDTSTYFGAAPRIDIQKSPDSQTVIVGGTVTFTITVANTGNVPLSDIVVSDPASTDCDRTFANIPVDRSVSYTCTKSGVMTSFTNLITATAKSGGITISDTDSADVIVDFLPDITLSKIADVSFVPATGGLVNYKLRISNIGPDTVVVTSLTDPKVTISPACLALIGQSIASGSYLECIIPNVLVISTGENSFINTATAIARDPEMNIDTATASATVTFGWYGRTPGFWKNKPEAWVSGYTPSRTIRSVFTVPSVLLKSGILDMSLPTGDDTLMDGLSYRGGTNLAGGFQILMRASVAALLNEAYYGVWYPGATSTSALIAEVNATLATQNRTAYLLLASKLDGWNNAIHSDLP